MLLCSGGGNTLHDDFFPSPRRVATTDGAFSTISNDFGEFSSLGCFSTRSELDWYGCDWLTDRCWNRFVFVLVASAAGKRGGAARREAVDLKQQ